MQYLSHFIFFREAYHHITYSVKKYIESGCSAVLCQIFLIWVVSKCIFMYYFVAIVSQLLLYMWLCRMKTHLCHLKTFFAQNKERKKMHFDTSLLKNSDLHYFCRVNSDKFHNKTVNSLVRIVICQTYFSSKIKIILLIIFN